MAITISVTARVPRWFRIRRICDRLHERHIRGVGDKMRQRRTLARWHKFDRMRREECPSLIGRPA